MRRLLLLVGVIVLLSSVAFAQDIDYLVIVKDNGEALVVVTINGSGLYRIPLQPDVDNLRVKGALYTIENRTAEISIGSTGKAVILYKTDLLTSKTGEDWSLDLDIPDMVHVVLNLPPAVNIETMIPHAYMEETQYMSVVWDSVSSNIKVKYSFRPDSLPEEPSLQQNHVFTMPLLSGLLIVLALLLIGLFVYNRNGVSKNKKNIISTLPSNEVSIVDTLAKHNGQIRRSDLEKRTKIAKSSLASSLHNLEKKNIIEVDRTFTTHIVRFTRWFRRL